MQHIYHKLLLIIALSCLSSPIWATHMVGGEINYRCLGNDMYEVSLTVFRDCDTGVPWFDSPAAIGVFDINHNLVYDVRIPLTAQNDTLSLTLSDPCLVVPPNVCIHTTTYRDTIYLPFLAGGYQLVYQRCCRNQDIVNIVDPLGTGATYYSYISEEALLGCNNSAVFREWPPVYICMGYPINFDHSAIDADGDSIVYEMCAPFDGALPFNPMPQPPFNPPYDSVVWNAGYSTNDMLGNPAAPLSIDPVTGLLTGTPSALGVYVVGVCAKEYRNGVLISTTKRDFQYAIGICGLQVSSAFFAPEVQCDNSLIVQFNNNSQGITNTYQWSFGDITNPTATSTLANPVYIYPDTGYYTITLIADPGSACADTSSREVYLQYESIITDFDVASAGCTDSLVLNVTDLTIDTISTITQWHWDFGNGQQANIPYASTVYTQSGTYVINLDVEAANGCTASLTDTITIELPDISSSDTVAICGGQTQVILNPGGNPNHQYQWSPTTGLSSSTAASPVASPSQTTTYSVTVTAYNGIDTCVLQKTVTVVIPPPIWVQLPPDSVSCQTSLNIAASSNSAVQWAWSFSSDWSSIFSTQNPTNIPLMMGVNSTVYVRGTDQYGCTATDTAVFTASPLPIQADFTYSPVNCTEQYSIQFNDATTDFSQGNIVSWQWNFGDGGSSVSQNPLHNYTQSGNYIISMLATSALGCSGVHLDTISMVLPLLNSADTVGICPGQNSIVLNPGGNPALQYQWSPATGLSSTTAASPTATLSSPRTYTVTVTAFNGGDTCVAVHQVHVLFAPPISVTSPPLVVYCGSTVTLTATSSTAVSYAWAGDPSFFTILSTSNPATFTPTTFPYAGYYVRATDQYGCTATDYTIVERRTTPVNVNFGYQSLGCSSTMSIQFTDLTTDLAGSYITAWNWTVSNGQSSTQQNPIFTFTNSQTYIVTLNITLANGCTGSASQSITLNIASINSNGTVGLCPGQTSAVLNPGGSPALQYQWAGAGLSATNVASPTATPPSTPYTYVVTVTGYNTLDTCVQVHNITVINAPPLSLSVVDDTTFCSTPYLLAANYQSGPGITLQWATNPNFAPVALTNVNPVYINFGSTATDFTLYVRLIDAYGCSVRDTTILRFRTAPILVDFASNVMGCSDTLDVQFNDLTADTLNSSISSWSWLFSNGQGSSQPNSNQYFTGNGPHTAALTVVLENGCRGVAYDTLFQDVPIFSSPDSIGLCGASSVQLNPAGNPNFIYQWSPATGLSSSTDASPIATPSANTNYVVTITAPNNGDTCQVVKTVSIAVGSFDLQAMPDTILCDNQIDLFVNNPNATNIIWALDRNFFLIIGQTNPFHTNVNVSRWFYVKGSDAFGCSAIDSVFVEVRNTPIVADFIGFPTYCSDSLVVQFYDITSDTTDNSIVSWQWTLGNGQAANVPNPIGTYNTNGTYPVTMQITTESGCQGAVSKEVVFTRPTLYLSDSSYICRGDSTELNFNASTDTSLHYNWSPNVNISATNQANPIAYPSSTTTYSVTVTGLFSIGGNVDTCRKTGTIKIIVPADPSVDALGGGTVCDSTAQLLAQSLQATSYQWSSDAGFGNIIGNDSLLQVAVTGQNTTYYVLIRNKYACEAMDSITVIGSAVDIETSVTQQLCSLQPVDLNVQVLVGNADSLTYLWSPDAELLSGQGTTAATTLPDADKVFTVIATNAYGCTDTAQVSSNFSGGIPPLDITASEDTVWSGDPVQLNATQDNGYTYIWQPHSSLNASNSAQANANPTESTTYYLTITDAFGCSNNDSVTVHTKNSICEEPNIFIPNTFTPNGDGLNDILYVRGLVISELYFAVYDRWGEKVFETSNPNIGWDGTFVGKQLPPDAYGYYLRVVCLGGEEFFKKGNVSIIR